jgi:hypothetical protein
MRTNDLTPEQRAQLAALGSAAADRFEALDPATTTFVDPDGLPPEQALRLAAHRAAVLTSEADQMVRDAVDHARAVGMSWHRVGASLGVTAEGARKRYSRAQGHPPAA